MPELVDVETVDLGFLIDADAHGGLQDEPEHDQRTTKR